MWIVKNVGVEKACVSLHGRNRIWTKKSTEQPSFFRRLNIELKSKIYVQHHRVLQRAHFSM
jgi:hypothetical protein